MRRPTGDRLRWSDEVRPESDITLPQLATPVRVPADLFAAKDDKRAERGKKLSQADLRRSHTILREFRAGLPRVQRALANVPTYMIMDDHDVTDDFFLNPLWRERVLKTALGRAILNNAMITYAVFQDWGNDPLRYDSGRPKELLTKISELFPAGSNDPGPADSSVHAAERAVRPQPAERRAARRPLGTGGPADPLGLQDRRAQAPGAGAGQPDPPQLRLPARSAGQRVRRRPCWTRSPIRRCRPARRSCWSSHRCRSSGRRCWTT